jgi:FixJ family two-component response regulator
MQLEPSVFLVDDDEAVLTSTRRLLQTVDLPAELFSGAREFLDAYNPTRPGCLVLDIRMPQMSGLELQKEMLARRIALPTIFITGHGDVATAVRAMKAGAETLIEKPFNDQILLDAIHGAIAKDSKLRAERAKRSSTLDRLALLTPRECEVLELVVDGETTKQIAFAQGTSHKTVEFHRANIMAKMQVGSVVELLRMVLSIKAE